MNLRVAGAQIPVSDNVEANAAAIGRAIEYASAEAADVLLTPEGSLSGYTPRFDAGEVSDALSVVVARAADAGLAIALGTCLVEPEDGLCYNQVRFYDERGRCLGFHSKTLTCGSLTDPPEGEINDYAVAPLRTFRLKGITVGGLICNDLWANPGCTPGPDTHLSRQLAEMGAQVIFHAVNGGRDVSQWSDVAWQYHESNLRMRARAGHVWIVTADNCAPEDIPCSSPSGVVAPDGGWAVRAPGCGEQFFAHTVELP